MRHLFRLGGQPPSIDRDIDDELAFHLRMRAESLGDRGFPREAAEREAMRRFGDWAGVRASCIHLDQQREDTMRRRRMFEDLMQDIGFAVRALRRSPGFATIAVATLALGIGANTAIFTLIDAAVLRSIPVRAPEELVTIGDPSRINWLSTGAPHTEIFSYPLYQDLVARTHVLSGIAASGVSPRVDVRIDSATQLEPEHPASRMVSANYFSVLGVPAARGRVFGPPEEGIVPSSPVVVISDQYWRQRFDADPAVVGRTILINGLRFTVIGITPPGFEGEVVGVRYDFWLPLSMQPLLHPRDAGLLSQRDASWMLLIGRRAPGVSFAAARAGVAQALRQAISDNARTPAELAAAAKLPMLISPGSHGFSQLRQDYRAPLFIMLAGMGLLLLIICANVANLLLARALARHTEFSVRLALGAGRGRLVRQLLTEAGILAGTSAMAGLAVAWVGGRALLVLAADGGRAIPLALGLDAPVTVFTVATSIISVAVFGLLPAVRSSRFDLAESLRARGMLGGLGARGQRFPVGTMMIVGQIALSLVLLTGAGLLVRNLRSLETAEVNVDRDHLLMVSVDLGSTGLHGVAVQQELEQLRLRLARLPGVTAVSYSENGIFNGSDVRSTVNVPGWTGHSGADSVSHQDITGPGYVAAIGGRLLAGRDFTTADMALTAAPTVIVNRAFAHFYFGAANPIGRSVGIDGPVPATIVGEIADIRDEALDAAPSRRFYSPLTADTGSNTLRNLAYAVRATGDPARLVESVRRAVVAENAAFEIDGATPLATLMSRSITEQRVLARVAAGFGILALLLSAIGLYGIMSYAVARRTGELGLRVALGAEPLRLIALVIRDAVRLVVLGTIIGVPLALAGARMLGSQVRIGAIGWSPIAISFGVLATAALIAAVLPAFRAVRVDPLTALRQQ